jgi:hypothetical protein
MCLTIILKIFRYSYKRVDFFQSLERLLDSPVKPDHDENMDTGMTEEGYELEGRRCLVRGGVLKSPCDGVYFP